MTKEHAACGVGFVAATDGEAQHALLGKAIGALCRVEHRGGVLADGATGDGAGIMAEVPFELLGVERGSVAVATLFLPQRSSRRRAALDCFEASLDHLGLEVGGYRDVPIDTSILGRQARESMPKIVHAFVKWPAFCRTAASFDQRLYLAKQSLRTRLRRAGINDE
ncbi:MAG: glutamate synthase large subunit, partial [Deltaproteobacteria bacterium]